MPNKILIVDDEPFNLDLLEQELEDQNYTIERANDGAEALAKVPSFEPDVILVSFAATTRTRCRSRTRRTFAVTIGSTA